MRVVVDTSVAHAYLVEKDSLHHAARSLLDGVEEVIVPSIVFHEVVWSIRRRCGARVAARAAERLLSLASRIEPVNRDDIVFALSNVKMYHDMLVLSVARRLDALLATFDAEMIRLAKRHGIPLLKPKRIPARGG